MKEVKKALIAIRTAERRKEKLKNYSDARGISMSAAFDRWVDRLPNCKKNKEDISES